ncbi:MAG: hypothetical protein GC150_07495 [Rhizobiales bacterium]|nr:hypothetical protein [Hyphomicrobiales bacterium]
MASKDDDEVVKYRVYETIWRNIDREDNLANQRILRAVLLTSGLFVATALLAETAADVKMPLWIRAIFLGLMIGLSVIGIVFSHRTRLGVHAAYAQSKGLMDLYAERKSEFDAMGLPRPFGDEWVGAEGTRSADVFPFILLVIWYSAVIAEFAFLVALLTWVITGSAEMPATKLTE